jgi:hypothetical protein
MSIKNSNDSIGKRTRDLPSCSALPPGAPSLNSKSGKKFKGKSKDAQVLRDSRLNLSDPMSDLVRHYDFTVPDAFLDL